MDSLGLVKKSPVKSSKGAMYAFLGRVPPVISNANIEENLMNEAEQNKFYEENVIRSLTMDGSSKKEFVFVKNQQERELGAIYPLCISTGENERERHGLDLFTAKSTNLESTPEKESGSLQVPSEPMVPLENRPAGPTKPHTGKKNDVECLVGENEGEKVQEPKLGNWKRKQTKRKGRRRDKPQSDGLDVWALKDVEQYGKKATKHLEIGTGMELEINGEYRMGSSSVQEGFFNQPSTSCSQRKSEELKVLSSTITDTNDFTTINLKQGSFLPLPQRRKARKKASEDEGAPVGCEERSRLKKIKPSNKEPQRTGKEVGEEGQKCQTRLAVGEGMGGNPQETQKRQVAKPQTKKEVGKGRRKCQTRLMVGEGMNGNLLETQEKQVAPPILDAKFDTQSSQQDGRVLLKLEKSCTGLHTETTSEHDFFRPLSRGKKQKKHEEVIRLHGENDEGCKEVVKRHNQSGGNVETSEIVSKKQASRKGQKKLYNFGIKEPTSETSPHAGNDRTGSLEPRVGVEEVLSAKKSTESREDFFLPVSQRLKRQKEKVEVLKSGEQKRNEDEKLKVDKGQKKEKRRRAEEKELEEYDPSSTRKKRRPKETKEKSANRRRVTNTNVDGEKKQDTTADQTALDPFLRARIQAQQLRAESKKASEENARLSAGKMAHPFFIRGFTSSLKSNAGSTGGGTFIQYAETRPPLSPAGPGHVTQSEQDRRPAPTWVNWTVNDYLPSRVTFHEDSPLQLLRLIRRSIPKMHTIQSVPLSLEGLARSSGEETDVSISHPHGQEMKNNWFISVWQYMQNKGWIETDGALPLKNQTSFGQEYSSVFQWASFDFGRFHEFLMGSSKELEQRKSSILQNMPLGQAIGSGGNSILGCDNVMWTDKYQPTCSQEVCGNREGVEAIRDWLKEWRSRILSQTAVPLVSNPTVKKVTSENCANEDSDNEVWLNEVDDMDSDGEADGLCNTLLLSGPVGCGKTAAVYACARELGFDVIEINASDCRNGSLIKQRFGEATESHGLNRWSNAENSFAEGAYESKQVDVIAVETGEKRLNDHPNAMFFMGKQNGSLSPPGGINKRKNNKSSKGTELGTPIVPPTTTVVATRPPMDSLGNRLGPTMSLVLFEEAEVLVEEDKGFTTALAQLAARKKRPIILTTNVANPMLPPVLLRHHVKFQAQLTKDLFLQTAMISAQENLQTPPSLLDRLACRSDHDLRRHLLTLQFWGQIARSRKQAEVPSLISNTQEILEETNSLPAKELVVSPLIVESSTEKQHVIATDVNNFSDSGEPCNGQQNAFSATSMPPVDFECLTGEVLRGKDDEKIAKSVSEELSFANGSLDEIQDLYDYDIYHRLAPQMLDISFVCSLSIAVQERVLELEKEEMYALDMAAANMGIETMACEKKRLEAVFLFRKLEREAKTVQRKAKVEAMKVQAEELKNIDMEEENDEVLRKRGGEENVPGEKGTIFTSPNLSKSFSGATVTERRGKRQRKKSVRLLHSDYEMETEICEDRTGKRQSYDMKSDCVHDFVQDMSILTFPSMDESNNVEYLVNSAGNSSMPVVRISVQRATRTNDSNGKGALRTMGKSKKLRRKVKTKRKVEKVAVEGVDENKSCECCGQPEPEETMLLCDICNAGWHMECLEVKLQELPHGDWFCKLCSPATVRDAGSENIQPRKEEQRFQVSVQVLNESREKSHLINVPENFAPEREAQLLGDNTTEENVLKKVVENSCLQEGDRRRICRELHDADNIETAVVFKMKHDRQKIKLVRKEIEKEEDAMFGCSDRIISHSGNVESRVSDNWQEAINFMTEPNESMLTVNEVCLQKTELTVDGSQSGRSKGLINGNQESKDGGTVPRDKRGIMDTVGEKILYSPKQMTSMKELFPTDLQQQQQNMTIGFLEDLDRKTSTDDINTMFWSSKNMHVESKDVYRDISQTLKKGDEGNSRDDESLKDPVVIDGRQQYAESFVFKQVEELVEMREDGDRKEQMESSEEKQLRREEVVEMREDDGKKEHSESSEVNKQRGEEVVETRDDDNIKENSESSEENLPRQEEVVESREDDNTKEHSKSSEQVLETTEVDNGKEHLESSEVKQVRREEEGVEMKENDHRSPVCGETIEECVSIEEQREENKYRSVRRQCDLRSMMQFVVNSPESPQKNYNTCFQKKKSEPNSNILHGIKVGMVSRERDGVMEYGQNGIEALHDETFLPCKPQLNVLKGQDSLSLDVRGGNITELEEIVPESCGEANVSKGNVFRSDYNPTAIDDGWKTMREKKDTFKHLVSEDTKSMVDVLKNIADMTESLSDADLLSNFEHIANMADSPCEEPLCIETRRRLPLHVKRQMRNDQRQTTTGMFTSSEAAMFLAHSSFCCCLQKSLPNEQSKVHMESLCSGKLRLEATNEEEMLWALLNSATKGVSKWEASNFDSIVTFPAVHDLDEARSKTHTLISQALTEMAPPGRLTAFGSALPDYVGYLSRMVDKEKDYRGERQKKSSRGHVCSSF